MPPNLSDETTGRADDVEVDDEIDRRLPGFRNEPAGKPGGDRKRHHQDHEKGRTAASPGRDAADDGAEEDRQERRRLDQGIAGRQLVARELVGEEAVLDRREKGGKAAEEEEGSKENRHRLKREADDGNGGCADLAELQPPGDDRLVESVRQLATQPGEEKEGCDEDGTTQRDQHFAAGGAELEQDENDQRVAEEIVVEGGEELAPEERRKPP
jgi:hypothetical protein